MYISHNSYEEEYTILSQARVRVTGFWCNPIRDYLSTETLGTELVAVV